MKMNRKIFSCLFLMFLCSNLFAQKKWFNDADLIKTGVYYYPEQWNEKQWERDFKKMHELGFEFTHLVEFAWVQMEPKEGIYDFSWLDRAISLAAKYDLKVILCTPTAAPPVWLTRKYPEVLIKLESGIKLDHGSRQQASFASSVYRELSFEMIKKLAQRYGHDPRIIGWQLDNEPAVQRDYNDKAQIAFCDFLRKKYNNDINALNVSWGTAFWSEKYSDFNEINIPRPSQMFMNSCQLMDYQRFATFETTNFLDEQCLLIKKYVVNQWVTTNYIPNYEEGHIGGSHQLDFVSYTRYMVYGDNEGIGRRGFRVGKPLRISFANDFFRPIQETYGVMELQPGQVNWGRINPQPLPGAVHLWLWNVFAGGSDFICTYRFRQPLYGTEQYHNGIIGTDGVTVSSGGEEYVQFMKEVRNIRKDYSDRKNVPEAYRARKAAILFNHENCWGIALQKQNYTWDTMSHIEKYYNALKSFGAPVDIISDDKDFNQYPVLIVPAYEMIDKQMLNRWIAYVKQGGHLVLTCRTGQKDRSGHFFEAPFGSFIKTLTGNNLEYFDLLLPQSPGKVVMDGVAYDWNTWGEILNPGADSKVLATYTDEFYNGKVAATTRNLGKGSVTYVGVDTKEGVLESNILKKIYASMNVPVMSLPYGVTVEYRNGLGIVLNYSDQVYHFILPPKAEILVGDASIPTAGVLVFKL